MNLNSVNSLQEATCLIKSADAIAIFAGAGMGVDSGLEQYRGEDGLWTKSIHLNNKEIKYYELMKPVAFKNEPELAWGLIGFLIDKFERTIPHIGFSILRKFVAQKEYFIVTSNIDNQFQKAGFNAKRILEYHGSIFDTQCGERIECEIWDTPYVKFNPETLVADSLIPICPECNSFCRPNIHLFDDDFFVPTISAGQQFLYMEWCEKIKSNCKNIIALEIGAGKTIPTIRMYAEKFAGEQRPLIRINPYDFETDQPNQIPIPFGAKESLIRINDWIERIDCPF